MQHETPRVKMLLVWPLLFLFKYIYINKNLYKDESGPNKIRMPLHFHIVKNNFSTIVPMFDEYFFYTHVQETKFCLTAAKAIATCSQIHIYTNRRNSSVGHSTASEHNKGARETIAHTVHAHLTRKLAKSSAK